MLVCIHYMPSHSAITPSELQRLADLTNLQLPDEPAVLSRQLSAIIDYVSRVQTAAADEKIISPPPGMWLRPDTTVADGLGRLEKEQPEWLKQSPQSEGQFVAVPGLFNADDHE